MSLDKEHDLLRGVPDWCQPAGLSDVSGEYYHRLEGGETLIEGLRSFRRFGVELVSNKDGGNYGKTVAPGRLGLYYNKHMAKFRAPGKYYRSGYRCKWATPATIDTGDALIRHGDVEIVQLGQNQTAVVLKPNHSIGVLPPGRHILRDRMRVVGSQIYNRAGVEEGRGKNGVQANMIQHVWDGRQWRATLIDVPKDMAAVIERVHPDGAELAIVPPGRYTLTEEGVKFKKLLTLFEEERTLSKVHAWTNDSVEVYVDLQMRFRLVGPEKIAHTGYEDAYDVLQEGAQAAVQSVVGTINYQHMMQTISLAPSAEEELEESETNKKKKDDDDEMPFDEQVRLGVKEYLINVGERVGVEVIDVFVKGRQFSKHLTAMMQAQAKSTLESVSKAKNIKRDLQTARKKIEAGAINEQTRADGRFYNAERESRSRALEVRSNANASAEAQERMAAAEAKAKLTLAQAEARAIEIEALAEANAEKAKREAAAHLPSGKGGKHAQTIAMLDRYAVLAKAMSDKRLVLDSSSELGKMLSNLSREALHS